MITEARQAIIDRALRTAFSTATYDTASVVPGGMSSALILRIVVAGRAYLVRVGGSPHADAATEMANIRSALVACHNDLKPANIVFDGARPWFVDWEAAFSNGRYADLANPASFFCDDADALLAAYLGAPAGAYDRARFFLMRLVIHVSYAALLATLAARCAPQPTPDYRAFHARLVDGSVALDRADIKLQYANLHLAAAREGMQSTRFAEALARVRQRSS